MVGINPFIYICVIFYIFYGSNLEILGKQYTFVGGLQTADYNGKSATNDDSYDCGNTNNQPFS